MDFARVLKKGKSKHKFGSRSTGRNLTADVFYHAQSSKAKMMALKKTNECLNSCNVIWLTGDTCIYLCVSIWRTFYPTIHSSQGRKKQTCIIYTCMHTHNIRNLSLALGNMFLNYKMLIVT